MWWKRMFWTIGLVLAFFATPWWVFFVFGIAGAIIFPWYIEFVIVAFGVDLLFSSSIFSIHYAYALISFILFLICNFIRQRLF